MNRRTVVIGVGIGLAVHGLAGVAEVGTPVAGGDFAARVVPAGVECGADVKGCAGLFHGCSATSCVIAVIVRGKGREVKRVIYPDQ